jgi:tetratricopeptide (TPR) repeat protein
MLLLDESAGKGIVAELRVTLDNRSDDAAVWSGAEVLQHLARDIVRDAYYATASVMPAGAAPPPFGMHRLDLVIDSLGRDANIIAVDGRSIGLPAALAFASTWAEQPISADVAAIGTVLRHQAIDAVGGVPEKAWALATFAGGRQLRIIAAPVNEKDIRAAGLVPVPARTLDGALQAAGLSPRVMRAGTLGSVVQRERALRELVTDIEMGDRTKYGGARARWEQLGDDLRALIRTLETTQTSLQPADFARARCIAALAYSHGGMLADVKDVLREIERPDDLPLSIRALFDIVRLGEHIDHGTLAQPIGEAAIATVTADLEELRCVGDREMLGRAAGTLGRAYMHLRELARAIPLLLEGVRHHAQHQRHEIARSRIYLSMALRMSARAPEALENLVTASAELETITRSHSPEYELATRPYLEYELARVLVSLERYEDAQRLASRALETCRWTFWPQLGILRVRAWASRMSGRVTEADTDVERMRPWAAAAGALGDRLLEEASGYPNEHGEIY